jgi:hypothetical protein
MNAPRALSILLLLAACDTKRAEDAATSWQVGRLEIDTREAEQALDPTFACAAIHPTSVVIKEAKYHDVVDKAVKTCRRTLVAFAERRLADAARHKGPAVVECLDVDRALDLLGKLAGPDPAPLALRRKGLCP